MITAVLSFNRFDILAVVNSAAGNTLVASLYNSSKIFPCDPGIIAQYHSGLVLIKVLEAHSQACVYVLTETLFMLRGQSSHERRHNPQH